MQRIKTYPPLRNTGFTLVEIMVGLVIGMLATAIILQVMTNFEAQKRTTTGTADAQTNGGIALYNIGREVQLAGYPLMPVTDSALECTTLTYNGSADSANRLTPLTIVDGTSDTITIRYGDSLRGGVPTPITDVTGNDITVNTNFGCQTGDTTLVISKTACAMTAASAVPILGATGSAVERTLTLRQTNGVVANSSNIACLGNWNEMSYAVNNGNLERNGTPIMEGIVNLQAQYGISATANSNQVTQWVNATGSWATPSVADRNRIKAIRIAVVARNPKKEAKDPATNSCITTTQCSSLTAASPTGLCAWDATSANPTTASPAPSINLSSIDSDWLCYRYRVFENIIPLRNMIWAKSTL